MAAKSEPWIQSTMAGFGSGIRRPDSERVVVWVNFVAAGVVSAKQLAFSMEMVTQFCHSYSKNGVAVVLLPNRAGDLRSSPAKPAWLAIGVILCCWIVQLWVFCCSHFPTFPG